MWDRHDFAQLHVACLLLHDRGMKIIPQVLGVLGCVMAVACGDGPADDGSANARFQVDRSTRIDRADASVAGANPLYASNNPLYAVANNPLYVGYNNPLYVGGVYGMAGANPLYRATQDDLARAPYEYVLHGSDAELAAWLSTGDILMEHGPAGDLAYAVVRSSIAKVVPDSLRP